MNKKHLSTSVRGTIAGLMILNALWLESRRPLRIPTQPKPRRAVRNLAMAGIASALFQPLLRSLVIPASRSVTHRRLGLLPALKLPRPIEFATAILAQDYLEYLWHRLNHRSGFLWRFHGVHHVDLDLDVTTAIRFHFGELFFSSFVQAGKVLILGIRPSDFTAYFTILPLAAQFHHSNVRLPLAIERTLSRLVVTPGMHGIHHSIVEEETDSNWGVLFNLWDRLHGTLRLDVPQEKITIGVPAYRDPAELTIGKLLLMSFRRQREWRLPDGRIPARDPSQLAA